MSQPRTQSQASVKTLRRRKVIQKYYTQLKIDTKKEESLQQSHSIDEADKQHELKKDIEEDVKQKVTETRGKKH